MNREGGKKNPHETLKYHPPTGEITSVFEMRKKEMGTLPQKLPHKRIRKGERKYELLPSGKEEVCPIHNLRITTLTKSKEGREDKKQHN